MYLLITVPTKLTTFSRCVIHGHDIASAGTQLFITLFLQPIIILPCTSGYSTGLLTRLGIMSSINQSWFMLIVFTSCSSSSLLLVIHRVLAISMNLSDRKKKIILIVYFAQLFAQILIIVVSGLSFEDGGKKARAICMKKLKDYPKEMDTFHGLNFAFSNDKLFTGVIVCAGLCVVYYLTSTSICAMILVRSIRRQARSSQSTQFLAKQRRITIGIIYFGMVKILTVGVPVVVISVCVSSSIGNVVVSHYAVISVALYPMIGPYYVLMSNPEYRKRVVELTTRAPKVTMLQPVSISS